MLRFIRRRRQTGHELELQRLRDNFGVSAKFGHGVPFEPHRMAVDCSRRLVAVITRSGRLELYDRRGHKRVLLKKLGSPCCFFDFVPGRELLVVACVPSTSTKLPESVHLVSTSAVDQCTTLNRPTRTARALCFTLASSPGGNVLLLCGCDDAAVLATNVGCDVEASASNSFESYVSLRPLLNQLNDDSIFTEFTNITTSSRYLLCTFRQSMVLILDLHTKQLVKSVDLKEQYTTLHMCHELGCALFASTSRCVSISLDSLDVVARTSDASRFAPTSFYHVVVSKRTNKPLVLYAQGVPNTKLRQAGNFNIVDGPHLFAFSFASELLDVRIVYSSDDAAVTTRRANAVLLLCAHELIAIDLLDTKYRPMNLNFLRCVDSSPVTSLCSVAVPNDMARWQTSARDVFSPRDRLFAASSAANSERPLASLILTGHENGSMYMWNLSDGAQRNLQTFEATKFVVTEDEWPVEREETEAVEQLIDAIARLDTDLSINDHIQLNAERNGRPDHDATAWHPAALWRRAEHIHHMEAGLYDDRAEDACLAIESLCFSPSSRTLVCGFHGGMVIVAELQDEETTTDKKMNVEVVESKLADGEPAALSQFTLRFKPPNEWPSTAFKLHRYQLALSPNTPVRCLAYSDDDQLIAAGTSTGIVLFNSHSGQIIYSKSFLSLNDIAFILAEEKPLTRLKSMKMSVRKTFRKRSLRMSRTSANKMVERQVEFRDTQLPTNNGVRCIRFHKQERRPTLLLVGTAVGTIYMLQLNTTGDSAYLLKEIRLSHRAPVVSIDFLHTDKATKMFVFTEEQIRGFTLDGSAVRPLNFSCKLTAKCGIRIRRACVTRAVDEFDFAYLTILSNGGDAIAMSTIDTRLRVSETFVNTADAMACRMLALNSRGEFAYLGSKSCTLIAVSSIR